VSLLQLLTTLVAQQGSFAQKRKTIWDATAPAPGVTSIDANAVAWAMSDSKLTYAEAFKLLEEDDSFDQTRYADPLRHQATLNALRYHSSSNKTDLSAKYGVLAAEQGLTVDRNNRYLKYPLRSDMAIYADIVARSEGTPHWRKNITEVSSEGDRGLSGSNGLLLQASKRTALPKVQRCSSSPAKTGSRPLLLRTYSAKPRRRKCRRCWNWLPIT
jgi:hypothetical protein